MIKFIASISWQNGYNILNIPKNAFISKESVYGKFEPMFNPITENYSRKYVQLIGLKLNDSAMRDLVGELDLKILSITNVHLVFGYIGFLTVEVYGCYKCEDMRLADNAFFDSVDADMRALVDVLSYKVEILDNMVRRDNDFTQYDDNLYFGQHKDLVEALHKADLIDDEDGNENYIFTYHSFFDNEDEFVRANKMLGIADEQKIKIDGNFVCQLFAHHLWLTSVPVDIDAMHKMSFIPILAAWEVLVYDVGAMNYLKSLKLIAKNKRIDSSVIRCMVNTNNVILEELGVCIRDQSICSMKYLERCQKEYMNQYRKETFFSSQNHLLSAVNGEDIASQSKSSKVIEFVISVLTAMSVYSVFCDGYSILMSTEPIRWNNFSSILFGVATIVMLIIVLLMIKSKK